jgi:hypothetical protein
MKKKIATLVLLAMVPLLFSPALAMDDLAKMVADGCKVELESGECIL